MLILKRFKEFIGSSGITEGLRWSGNRGVGVEMDVFHLSAQNLHFLWRIAEYLLKGAYKVDYANFKGRNTWNTYPISIGNRG